MTVHLLKKALLFFKNLWLNSLEFYVKSLSR